MDGIYVFCCNVNSHFYTELPYRNVSEYAGKGDAVVIDKTSNSDKKHCFWFVLVVFFMTSRSIQHIKRMHRKLSSAVAKNP